MSHEIDNNMEKWNKALHINNKMQLIAENIEIRYQLSPYKRFSTQPHNASGLEIFGLEDNLPAKIDYSGFLDHVRKFIYESTNTISGMFHRKIISEPDKDRLLTELVNLNKEVKQLKNLTKN